MSSTLRARVTKSVVDRLLPNQMVRDTEVRGFGVRRQLGAPVYFLRKKIRGRDRWIIIGPHGAPWTPETARGEAHRLIGMIAGGKDPSPAVRDLDNPTVAEATEHFMAEHGVNLKPTSAEKYEILLRLHILPAVGYLRVADLTRAEVLKLHARLARKASTANYCVAILSKLMSWCEERGLRLPQSNPCFKLKKFRETKRQRYLSSEEIGRLSAVLEEHSLRGGESLFIVAAIRLLLLTGARVGEILNLKWAHVDLERGVLLLPDSKTGQKTIRLNRHACSILAALPRVQGNPFVIVGRREGARLINLQKPWRRLRAEAGLPDVRMHDLRHSFASTAAGLKGSLHMIGKLLGHSHPHTTARYAHLADDPVQKLNDEVGEAIAAAMAPAVK
jgi:integrase